MNTQTFISFLLQLRSLLSFRDDKNIKICLCCAFEKESHRHIRKQIEILLETYLESKGPLSGGMKLILGKAKDIFPELDNSQLSDLVNSILFD